MAGLKSSMTVFMMVMMVASIQMQTSMAQTRHVVGDALGWTIPSNGAAAYTTWASQQTFKVGDSLFFNFTTGNHNVAEVSQAAYGPCTTTGPISLATTGPATVALTNPGTHYYICGVGTHCQIGQKLTINVTAAATPPAAAPTTPPPAATPTATPPAATPTATPTPSPVSPPTTTPTAAPTPSPTSSDAPTPAGATPPSPDTTTGPSPSGSTTPSPAGDSTPSPPSPSAAAGPLAAVVPATLLAFGLALFY